MRGQSKFEDLAPSCVKITNSTDFYLSVGVRISREKLKKFIPFLAGANSDEKMIPSKAEPLSIRGIEFSNYNRRYHKQATSILPKLDEGATNKYYSSMKPLTEKLSVKKSPSKKSVPAKKDLIPEKVNNKQISPIKSKIITKVSYKEACRLPEWSMIAKPELERLWRNLIGLSNGIKPLSNSSAQFKYYVGKGNNSALIKKLMQSRGWWIATDNISEAHFVWTQWKDKDYIQKLPVSSTEHFLDSNSVPSISYQVPVKINNIYRQVDLSDLGLYKIKNSASYSALSASETSPLSTRLYNKLEFNQHLSNKKGLFKYLKKYYEALGKNVFESHPVTFHISNGEEDTEFQRFLEVFNKHEKLKKKKKSKNIWIIKPGENSNRGNGIQVCKSLAEIKMVIKEKFDPRTNAPRTYILQKYLEKPLLVNSRKFDIRCYSLVTCINGVLQAYFYTDGYIRTSCVEYSLNDTSNNFIHLTNDAVQKHSEDYGKYEDNNKMTYKDLQRYLDFDYPDHNINFFLTTLPKIKAIVRDTIQAVYLSIDKHKRLNCMELFGYDFMLDTKFKPWIIEVNTNPCLELSSSYLSYLIPAVVDNAFRVTVDTLFPPPSFNRNHEPIPENRFDLIFHSVVDGVKIRDKLVSLACEDFDISDTEEIFPDIDPQPKEV